MPRRRSLAQRKSCRPSSSLLRKVTLKCALRPPGTILRDNNDLFRPINFRLR